MVSRTWQTAAIILLVLLTASITIILVTLPGEPDCDDGRPPPPPPGVDVVAVIFIEGVMITEDADPDSGYTSSNKIAGLIREATDDEDVKAIVLRVNSPGGTPSAAQEINMEIERARQEGKPVLVSMGDMAASGAYYISAAADAIYATPDTNTGSIGVIWVFTDMTQYYENEGISYWVAKSGDLKDMGSSWRNLTEEERDHATSIVMQMFDRFVDTIVQGRNLSEDYVHEISDGRIYTGENALNMGLIDGYANLYGTIEHAAELGGVTDYDIEMMNDEDVYYTYQANSELITGIITSSGLTGGRAYLLYI
jgi:protease-4